MKGLWSVVVSGLVLAGIAPAQEARYYRVAGPVPTTITSFSGNGDLTWTNVATNATFNIQVANSLTDPSNWVDYVEAPSPNGATKHGIFREFPPTDMALIPAGPFEMGNCMDPNEGSTGELPVHSVYVSAFYIDKYDVTKALWDDVYNWATNHGYSFDNPGVGKAPDHPVVTLNWYDCVKWCNARSEKEGKTPAYRGDPCWASWYVSGSFQPPNDCVIWNGGYRLPTEAEWEKAARGGASGHRYPWTDADTIQHARANYICYEGLYPYDTSPTHGMHPTFNDKIDPRTNPVGYFAPNGYGLYDMAGNVLNWCWDRHDVNYYYTCSTNPPRPGNFWPTKDPRGPETGGGRVLRNGSWTGGATQSRTANRNSGNSPEAVNSHRGFRCVLPEVRHEFWN